MNVLINEQIFTDILMFIWSSICFFSNVTIFTIVWLSKVDLHFNNNKKKLNYHLQLNTENLQILLGIHI